jgi:hypothetical protein
LQPRLRNIPDLQVADPQFSAQQLVFFFKTNVRINFLHEKQYFEKKTPIFSPNFSAKKNIFEIKTSGPAPFIYFRRSEMRHCNFVAYYDLPQLQSQNLPEKLEVVQG